MKRILILFLAATALVTGQQKISDRTTLASPGIDTAADWIGISDMSATGSARDKKTSLGEMWKQLGGTNVSSTELGYLDGVTSAIQTQLDAKPGLDVQAVQDSVNTQPWTAAKIAGWTTGGGGTAAPVRMLILGDSLISVGGGLPLGPNMGQAGIIGLQTYNTSGTVTNHSPPSSGRFDYWINGKATTLAVGATAQFTNGGAATGDIRGDKACIAYIKQSGGGSFVLQYASNGTGNASGASDTGWTALATIDTANATTIGAYGEYDLPTSNSPFYRLRVKSVTTGSVVIVTTGIYNSNGGGVIHMPIASVSGLDVTDSNTTPAAVFTPIWTGLKPDMVFSLWADTNTVWDSGGAFRTFYAAAKAAWNPTDWIQISRNISYEDNATAWATSTSYALNALTYATISGNVVLYRCTSAHTSAALTQPGVGANWATVWVVEAPKSSVETTSAVFSTSQAASQRAWALATGETFINGAALFGSTWTNANSKGLMGDIVHPSTAGVTLRNMHIWSKLPVGSWYLGGSMKLGMNEAEINASPTSGNILGQAVEFSRSPAVRSATGSFRLFDQTTLMDNSKTWSIFANNSQLRFNQGSSTGGYFDLGSGLAGFYAGGSNWALGSSSVRWKGWFADTDIAGEVNHTLGDFTINTIGKTLKVKSGTNALAGTVTLTAGAGTISSTAIDTNTAIVLSLKTVGGTIAAQPYVATFTPGTGCTISGGGASNTSTYNWVGIKVN